MTDAEQQIFDKAVGLLSLLASMDEWLGNSEGLMIEDVVAWRDQLAALLGQPSFEAKYATDVRRC